MEEKVHVWAEFITQAESTSSNLFMQLVWLCIAQLFCLAGSLTSCQQSIVTHLNRWSISTHGTFLAIYIRLLKLLNVILLSWMHGRPVCIWDNNLDTGWRLKILWSIFQYNSIWRFAYCFVLQHDISMHVFGAFMFQINSRFLKFILSKAHVC